MTTFVDDDSSYSSAASRDATPSPADDDAESTASSQSSSSSSTSGFIGVRALQPTTADLDRYRLRDYPLGSAFAFDVRPGAIAAKITLTAGARLHLSSATIVEIDDDDEEEDSSDEDNKKDSKRSAVKKAALTINMPGDTAEAPYPDDEDYDGGGGPGGASDGTMVLWDYRAGEARTITGLGVSVSGPTSLSLGVRCRSASSSLRSINVFGSVVLDDQVVSYGLDSDDDDDEQDAYYAEEEDGEYFEEEKYWGVPLDDQERDLMRQLMDDEREELEREAADNDARMGEEGDDDTANAAKKTKLKKKRKMSADRDDASVDNNEEEIKPLSKKQRKKLAQKKAQELADAVAKEQGHDEKKKKKNKDKEEVPTKSLTRERRIEGGVVVQDIIIGIGPAVKPGRKVSINYEGSLASDGSVFDRNKSKSSPLSFRPGTGEVIKGLDKGMEGMKAGGERIITIPPAMGYGKKAQGAMIPKNSTLVFTVKLLGVGGK